MSLFAGCLWRELWLASALLTRRRHWRVVFHPGGMPAISRWSSAANTTGTRPPPASASWRDASERRSQEGIRATIGGGQQLFGIGLVKTSEDFGVQGEKPSHPELLDWLAADFRNSGWNVKGLMKRIVMSATYRQSSHLAPGMAERDPQNRLLARGSRYRLPSWMIRDQALAASGLFVEQVGGPPVRPYQPEGVWEEATFGGKRYIPDTGEALYRRSLYTFWRRIIGPTMFFDVAPRQTCIVKPVRTNTPLQALAVMNDVQYIEAARALSERAMQASPDREGRITFAFRRLLGRKPKPEEVAVLVASYDRQLAEYAQSPTEADKLLKQGASPRDAALNVPEHAALTGVTLILLNLDETLTRE